MSTTLLIQPLLLDPADFPPLPLSPGFAQLVSGELDGQGLPTDGFDTVVGEVIAIVDALDVALGGLGLDLLDAFTEADAIDAQPVGDTAAGFAGSLAASDAAVGDLGTLLAGATSPAPAGGGGGAAGGAGGGGTAGGMVGFGAQAANGCEAVLDYGGVLKGAALPDASIQFRNGSDKPVSIGHSIQPTNLRTVFQVSGFPSSPLPPGGSGTFTISAAAIFAGDYNARLVVTTDEATSPHQVCLHLAVGTGTVRPPV